MNRISIVFQKKRSSIIMPILMLLANSINAQDSTRLKKHALKTSVVTPLFYYIDLVYEHSISRRNNVEIRTSFIALGERNVSKPSGFILNALLKHRLSDLSTRLKGLYIGPEVYYGWSEYDQIDRITPIHKRFKARGIIGILGYQFLIGNQAVLNISSGLGYGTIKVGSDCNRCGLDGVTGGVVKFSLDMGWAF